MTREEQTEGLLKYTCCYCNAKYDSLSKFFKTNSDLYLGTGCVPICKKCLNSLFLSYWDIYGDPQKAIKRICMAFDFYYSDSIYETCKNDSEDSMLGNYIKRLNMKQYVGKTFDRSLKEGFSFESDGKSKNKKILARPSLDEPEVSSEDTRKWGDGFSATDYSILNDHYTYLKNANPQCDNNQEIFISDLCYTKMQQMKAVREGRVDDYNKLTDSYRKTFAQAGLKTVKESASAEEMTLGVTIETIEKYTPAEYYKNKELYRDHDNIGDYLERFLLRPLRNLMHGTTDRDFEFYVKSEDEADEHYE